MDARFFFGFLFEPGWLLFAAAANVVAEVGVGWFEVWFWGNVEAEGVVWWEGVVCVEDVGAGESCLRC